MIILHRCVDFLESQPGKASRLLGVCKPSLTGKQLKKTRERESEKTSKEAAVLWIHTTLYYLLVLPITFLFLKGIQIQLIIILYITSLKGEIFKNKDSI